MKAVIKVLNYFLARAEEPGSTGVETYRRALTLETAVRQKTEKHSRSLVLRDAQRFLYGTVGRYMWSDPKAITTNDKATRWEGPPATKPPSTSNFLGYLAAYYADTLYSLQKDFLWSTGLEKWNRSVPDRPSSAVGGSEWYGAGQWRDDKAKLESAGPVSPLTLEQVKKWEETSNRWEEAVIQAQSRGLMMMP
jgi:hypothetical protein